MNKTKKIILWGWGITLLAISFKLVYEEGKVIGYVRGSYATMMHHKCFGNYGSKLYRRNVIKSGKDPQTKDEVRELAEIAEKKQPAFMSGNGSFGKITFTNCEVSKGVDMLSPEVTADEIIVNGKKVTAEEANKLLRRGK